MRRYELVRSAAQKRKAGGQALGAGAVVGLTGLAPPVLHASLARLMYSKRLFNITITNLPGSPRRLYGADDTFSADDFRAALPEEKRQFRFIVSPEDGGRLDLTEFARQLMAQVEKDTGRRLVWAAVNHHNTDGPHVHLVIRGVDRDGHDLRIDGK